MAKLLPGEDVTSDYTSQAARDAVASGYGGPDYAAYIEQSARDAHAYFTRNGRPDLAETMLTRSLWEALMGNDGD